jgi:hypothetical protein
LHTSQTLEVPEAGLQLSLNNFHSFCTDPPEEGSIMTGENKKLPKFKALKTTFVGNESRASDKRHFLSTSSRQVS